MRSRWGRAVLLVPSAPLARRRAEGLILEGEGTAGAWGRPVQTFQDFVMGLLSSAGREGAVLGDLEQRYLLEQAVEGLRGRSALDAVGASATTPGFIRHMQRIVTDLKQAAIEPDAFRERVRARKNGSPLDEVVADVYAAYQEALIGAGAYDRVGLYWEAALLCRGGHPAALEGVELLVLDDFDDFTPSEFRLLAAIEPHVEELVFGLNCNAEEPSQADLYALTRDTVQRVKDTFPSNELRAFAEDGPRSFVEFAASQVFWRTPPARPPDLRPDLELVPCAGCVQEIETIGRRVKGLLVEEAVPLEEVAIIFRNLGGVADTIRAVFDEFGIPVRIDHRPALAQSAACAFLLDLLDATGEWRREPILDIVTSPWFRPEPPPAPRGKALAGRIARMARVVSGYREWGQRAGHLLGRLEAASARADEDEEAQRTLERMPDARDAAQTLLDLLGSLKNAAALVPERGTLQDYGRAMEALVEACGIERALAAEAASIAPVRASEAAALEALRGLLTRLSTGLAPLAAPARRWTRSEFLAWFRQALRDTPYAPPQAAVGVHCLDAERARHLRFDYVFFGGVNEGEVPQPASVNAVYSEEDIAELEGVEVRLAGRRKQADRERVLFHHVLDVARERLWITWRTVSPDERPASPSPFIADILELFDDCRGVVLSPPPPPHAFVPSLDAVASPRDLRNALLFRGEPGALARFGEEVAPFRERAGVDIGRHRAGPFDAYDGVLSDPARIEAIAGRFGANRQFSAAQLEAYALCPFQFFVEYVLGLEDEEMPVAEFDPRIRGTILHEILQRFHARYRGQSVPDVAEQDADEAMSRLVDEVFAARAARSVTAPPGVVAVERERMRAILARYLALERAAGDANWKPQYFEVAFGHAWGAAGDGPSRAEPVTLDTPAGPVLLAGRIDRIDEDEGGANVRVIDYKTTVHVKQKDVKSGASLQLGLYAMALEGHLMSEADCRAAWFAWVGRSRAFWEEVMHRGGKKDEWAERQAIVRDRAGEAVAGIRQGV
ncbi:MAG: PD-(D/E)XK nuclease family protein, partial [Candidatus Hydrogenedentes bacterium]|nr:PD-(D/E)XK nuclease family protein [Candidatus Hydrogenedentota bacterium]